MGLGVRCEHGSKLLEKLCRVAKALVFDLGTILSNKGLVPRQQIKESLDRFLVIGISTLLFELA